MQGILFDMDGVLFDTERLACSIGPKVGEQMGFTITNDMMLELTGVTDEYSREYFTRQFGPSFDYGVFSQNYVDVMLAVIERDGLPEKAGARETLALLKEQGYPLALASSNSRAAIEFYLSRSGFGAFFDTVVTGNDVSRSKPDPEIFLLAAQRLGLDIKNCLAVEDSFNGIRSASAAGCAAVMIPDLLAPTDEIRALANAVLPDLYALPAFLQEFRGVTPD